MTMLAMCQDCGRAHPLEALIPDANEPPGLCPVCRGAACTCSNCQEGLSALARGDWWNANLQLHAALRAISWTPEGGLVLRERRPSDPPAQPAPGYRLRPGQPRPLRDDER
jgi:hypothetical protein